MTNIIHSLRDHSRPLATALLGVLLATWLVLLCPDCFAQAAEAPPSTAGHCHSDPAPVQDTDHDSGRHDCCESTLAAPCAGGACVETISVSLNSHETAPMSSVQFDIVPITAELSALRPTPPPESAPHLTSVFNLSCPLYLRHCVFLN